MNIFGIPIFMSYEYFSNFINTNFPDHLGFMSSDIGLLTYFIVNFMYIICICIFVHIIYKICMFVVNHIF